MKALRIFIPFLFILGMLSGAHAECDLDSYLNASNMSDAQIDEFNREIARCRKEDGMAAAEMQKFEAMINSMKAPDEMLADHNAAVGQMQEVRRLYLYLTSQLLAVNSSADQKANMAALSSAIEQSGGLDVLFNKLKANWAYSLSANPTSVGSPAFAYLTGQVEVNAEMSAVLAQFRSQFPNYFWNSKKVPMESVIATERALNSFNKSFSVAEKIVAKQFVDNWNNKSFGQLKANLDIYKADLYWSVINKNLGLAEVLQRSKREQYYGVVGINLKELDMIKIQMGKIEEQAPTDLKAPLSQKISKSLADINATMDQLQKQDQQRSRQLLSLSIKAREKQLNDLGCGEAVVNFDKEKVENKALELYYVQLAKAQAYCGRKK